MAVRLHRRSTPPSPSGAATTAHVLATPAAMAARFADHPDAVAETAALAERLRFDLRADLGYRYPGAEDAEAGARARRALPRRAGGALRRPAPATREALARLEEELRVIERLGLAGFFLLHHDMLELAREVAVEVRGPDTRPRAPAARRAGGAPRCPRSSAT